MVDVYISDNVPLFKVMDEMGLGSDRSQMVSLKPKEGFSLLLSINEQGEVLGNSETYAKHLNMEYKRSDKPPVFEPSNIGEFAMAGFADVGRSETLPELVGKFQTEHLSQQMENLTRYASVYKEAAPGLEQGLSWVQHKLEPIVEKLSPIDAFVKRLELDEHSADADLNPVLGYYADNGLHLTRSMDAYRARHAHDIFAQAVTESLEFANSGTYDDLEYGTHKLSPAAWVSITKNIASQDLVDQLDFLQNTVAHPRMYEERFEDTYSKPMETFQAGLVLSLSQREGLRPDTYLELSKITTQVPLYSDVYGAMQKANEHIGRELNRLQKIDFDYEAANKSNQHQVIAKLVELLPELPRTDTLPFMSNKASELLANVNAETPLTVASREQLAFANKLAEDLYDLAEPFDLNGLRRLGFNSSNNASVISYPEFPEEVANLIAEQIQGHQMPSKSLDRNDLTALVTTNSFNSMEDAVRALQEYDGFGVSKEHAIIHAGRDLSSDAIAALYSNDVLDAQKRAANLPDAFKPQEVAKSLDYADTLTAMYGVDKGKEILEKTPLVTSERHPQHKLFEINPENERKKELEEMEKLNERRKTSKTLSELLGR